MVLLRILIICAKNLKQSKAAGSSGYYVSVTCSVASKNTKRTTKVAGKSSNPVWKEKFEFQLQESLQDIKFVIVVKNAKVFPRCNRNRIAGWNEVSFENLTKLKEINATNYELPLLDKNNQPTYGTLQLKFHLLDDVQAASPDTPLKQEVQKGAGYFIIDVFHADGLPRMDLGNIFDCQKLRRQLVDCYLVATFMDNRVTTSIIPSCVNPVWNERLYLPFNFPLQSDSIKIELKDEDIFTGDDLIATSYLSLSDITANHKEGCLPCFGPAFINFYGSQRQFRILENDKIKELNSGMVEGCSFRGRAFLQIQTELGSLPDNVKQEIPALSVEKAQKFERKKMYTLRAAFLECYSLRSRDLATLEISFGLFGNSEIDDPEFWRPSCIPPFSPIVSNGENSQMFHAFWGMDKPCIIFNVEAPTSLKRLEMSNFLWSLSQHFDGLIQRLIKIRGRKICEKTVEERVEKFLSDFNTKCTRFSEIVMSPESSTELDIQIFQMTKNCLLDISEKIGSKKFNATKMEEIIASFAETCEKMQELRAIMPQNDFPDVFIWLYHDWRRVAYCRVPIIDVLFSENSDERGRLCNLTTSWTLKYPHDAKVVTQIDPGVVRANFWFGLEENLSTSLSSDDNVGGSYTMVAETYENRLRCCGKIRNSLALVRWTDFLGRKYFKKNDFPAIAGWDFDGEWISECKENASGNESSGVVAQKPEKNDANGKVEMKGRVEANGQVEANAQVDVNASPQEKTQIPIVTPEKNEEFNSSISKAIPSSKMASPKTSSKNVQAKSANAQQVKWRRKMVPTGTIVLPVQSTCTLKKKTNDWNFHFPSPTFYLQFQEMQYYKLKIYLYQARNLSAGDKSGFSDPFVRFIFLSKVKDSKCIAESLCPVWNQTLVINDIPLAGRPLTPSNHLPEVSAELYDQDPNNQTEYLGKANFQPVIGPIKHLSSSFLIWRPIILDDNIAGDLLVSAELSLDKSQLHSKTSSNEHTLTEFLKLKKVDQVIENFSKTVISNNNGVDELPDEVKPPMTKADLEILCIGLRNWDSDDNTLTQPFVEFLCDSPTPIAKTDEIAKFPQQTDFRTKFLKVEITLPEDPAFLSSITIRLKNRGPFGKISAVGASIVKDLKRFVTVDQKIPPPLKPIEEIESIIGIYKSDFRKESAKTGLKSAQETSAEDGDLDWWSKYYASKGETTCSKYGDFLQRGFQPMQIFDCELEKVEPLKSAMNFVQTLPIYAGKSLEGESQTLIAELKANFHISYTATHINPHFTNDGYSLSEMAKRIERILPNVLLRLYLIRAFDLPARDFGKESDPYVRVKVGETAKKLEESLRRNSLNPIFGCIFESVIALPKDSQLVITVHDKDVIRDDLIGEAVIDLESRIFAPCWSTCGLSPQYLTSGPYAWRDIKTPKKILEEMCALRGVPYPQFDWSNRIELANTKLDLQDIEKGLLKPPLESAEECMALRMLQQHNFGIPEHVETRTLFHPSKPGIPQGKLEMWIDMFPMKEAGIVPPPVNISPRTPKSYVLRCIVYNAYDVPMDDKNLLGDEMSDVFVKGWLKGMEEQPQTTDVHHRCIDGEANFNWRFVYPFQFLHGENTIIHQKRKRFFDYHLTEVAIPPTLCLQIYDYDMLSRDDSLGILELEFAALIPPQKRRKKRKLKLRKKKTKHVPHINLFKQQHIRGIWLCPSSKEGEGNIGGKLELELELLTEEKAQLRPAGIGREEPNLNPRLEPPIRPSTSFFWLTSPLKFLKFLLFKRFRKFFLIMLLVVFGILLLYLIFERLLDASIHKLVYSI